MEAIKIKVKGTALEVVQVGILTAGTVGLQMQFTFDEAWDGLIKTAVFCAGREIRDVANITDCAVVPWEVMTQTGRPLCVGVYGASADGTVVIPTVWASCGTIRAGADPSGDASTDPTLPVWQQVLACVPTVEQILAALPDGDEVSY